MIRILSRIFIKNHRDIGHPDVRRRYGMLLGLVGIALNLLLFAAKAVAGLVTGSIAVTADAINNLSDAGSSIITLLGFKLAAKKPHSDHPYGHGRYEYIAGLVVSMAILMMGFELAKTSVTSIFRPRGVEFSIVSAIILALSMLVKLYMAFYNRRMGKKLRSVTLSAAAADSLSDVCATGVVLASTLVYRYTGMNIDGWAGTAVSLLILWAGYSAARDTISPLLGKAPDPAFVRQISDIVASYPEVIGMHDLMVHDYGAGRVMISLHAEVPASGDILAMHDVIDSIERRLLTELSCAATIHMDPISTDDEQIACTRRQLETRIFETLGGEISIHDFRIMAGSSHTKLIFDVLVPYDYPMSDREVRRKIAELVQENGSEYFAVITIDHPISQ